MTSLRAADGFPSRRRRGPALTALVAIVVGIVASLTMEVTGYLATPDSARPDISYVTVHAAVPLAFAACAIVAVIVRERSLPLALMIAFIYLWIPPTFFAVVAGFGGIWPVLHSIDLVWALLLGLLALSYPSGSWTGVWSRILVAVAIGAVLVRGAAALLLYQPPVTCECAPNVYALVPADGLWQTVDLSFRVFGGSLILVVTIDLFRRWASSNRPARSVSFVMPIGLTAWAISVVLDAVFSATRGVVTGPALVVPPASGGAISVLSLFAVSSVPICYVAGTVRLRNTRGRIADLVAITRSGADRALWRDSLARTLGDPALEVYWWDGSAFRDDRGAEADLRGRRRRTLLPIFSGDGAPIAVIRHDRTLSDDERLLDGVAAALRLTVDNGALRSEVERRLAQVRESRQRIVEAGDIARKRLERDLHDGSQQQLVALAMQLRGIVGGLRMEGQVELADQTEQALTRLTVALRELRELARGIHPTALVEGGLELALPELASRCPVPVTCEVHDLRSLPELVEATAYFVAAECLANIARHSQATRVRLSAWCDEEELHLVVSDDGIGGATTTGSGITGLVDRVEAVGGDLHLDSAFGHGTTITTRMPLVPAPQSGLV